MSIKNIIIKGIKFVPFGLRSKIKNIPGLKQLQSALLKRWVSHSQFDDIITGGPAKGLMFPVQMPQDKGMWIGTFELDFAEALSNYIQPNWICYDIGAYKGYYAGIMALRGAKHVYVFEPMPENAKSIARLISLNPSLPIHLQNVAVSDVVGQETFSMMPMETMGKLNKSSFQKDDEALQQIKVNTVTLDSLINEGMPEPDFIKIDVEGAEEFVLRGAKKLLESKRPFLMIEMHSPEIGKRCLEVLKQFYTNIKVVETGESPEKGTPEICHYVAFQ